MTPAARTWPRFFAEERDAYVLGLLRLAISALLFLHCARYAQELVRTGYFADYFYLPMIPASWLPARTGYALLLGCQALTALASFFGWRPREALFVAAGIGFFVLLSDRLQYHNNRYALLLLAFLLSFTPCDRSFLLARRARNLPQPERVAPTFARRLFQIQVSLVYLGSAIGKLLDADWRGGQVLLLRFMKTGEVAVQHGVTLPPWLDQLLGSPLLANLAAKGAISTELFIALGVWFPRTRRIALWVGVLFHFWIEVSARVELFSWVMGASYLAFVLPELRERRFEYDPERPLGRASARLVRALDWCARFEIAPLPPVERGQPSYYVSNRAGQRAHGWRGAAQLAEAIPLLFVFWPPLALASLRRAPKR